jgi:hypothetical protein
MLKAKSKFADHLIQKCYEMRNIEEIMTIVGLENDHVKINMLEEIHIRSHQKC